MINLNTILNMDSLLTLQGTKIIFFNFICSLYIFKYYKYFCFNFYNSILRFAYNKGVYNINNVQYIFILALLS